MHRRLPPILLTLGALLVPAQLPVAADAAVRPTGWAPAARATITPGVQMFTRGAQCTANFVFTDARDRVHLGYAAHCAGTGGATDVNGCENGSVPLGTRVRFAEGATAATPGTTVGRGRLVYSSWRTMRRRGITREGICTGNDFALVRVGRAHRDTVNPTVPRWGGPTGVTGPPAVGDQVFGYGSSTLRPSEALSPRTGTSLGTTNGGWGFDVYTATPGVPGDSGSGFLDRDGRAVGTLSTVALAPLAGSNGVGTLARELRFAQRHSGIEGLRLARGTEPFSPLP